MARDPEKTARRWAEGFHALVAEADGATGAGRIGRELAGLKTLAEGKAGKFFSSPVFKPEEKRLVLEGVFDMHGVDPRVSRLTALLVDVEDFGLLPAIADAYLAVDRRARDEVVAEIRTAMALSNEEADRLRAALAVSTGKAVRMEVSVDPSLIAGVTARVGSVVYDASVRGVLERISKE